MRPPGDTPVDIGESRGRRYRVAVVLGSGLSGIAAALAADDRVAYEDLGSFPNATVAGHPGALHTATVSGVPTMFFAGRVHLYEGHAPTTVAFAVRAAAAAGCDTIVLTNAAGGIDPSLQVGAPCLISDHLNLTGADINKLVPGDATRFLDLTDTYDPDLIKLALSVDPTLRTGVYAGVRGPAYETPAEIRMLRSMGAGLVGMSTVVEAIAARYLGLRVLGISLVTNVAAGLRDEPLSHAEVQAAGAAGAGRIQDLLTELIPLL